jgi:hypothetical protein
MNNYICSVELFSAFLVRKLLLYQDQTSSYPFGDIIKCVRFIVQQLDNVICYTLESDCGFRGWYGMILAGRDSCQNPARNANSVDI